MIKIRIILTRLSFSFDSILFPSYSRWYTSRIDILIAEMMAAFRSALLGEFWVGVEAYHALLMAKDLLGVLLMYMHNQVTTQ